MNRKRILVIVLVVIVLGGTTVYATWFRRDNALQGSGTVEARDIRVGSKVGGRIDKVLVLEGDRVQPGQTLITFDDQELLASLNQSRAAAEKAQRGYRPEEIAEARAAAAQAKADYEMRLNGYRKEDIAAAQSDVERAAADEARSRLDFQRYEALAQKDLVSKQQRDTSEANWKMALAQQQNYQHKLDELRRGYRPEEIASAEAHYREAQPARGRRACQSRVRVRRSTVPRAASRGAVGGDRGSSGCPSGRYYFAEYASRHAAGARSDLCAHLYSGN